MTSGNIVAILGAAGATGKAAARVLAREPGVRIRLVGRREPALLEVLNTLPAGSAEIRAADLETESGAASALAGCQMAVMTLGLPYQDFGRYPALMRNVVQQAERAGVRRLLLVTNIYAYGRPKQSGLIDETHPTEPCSFKGRMRLEQERVLQASSLEWMILRLPDFFGPEADLSFAKTLFDAAAAGKRAQLLSPSDTPHQFVYTDDVGPVIARLLASPVGWNQTYHFAGSGLTTTEEFAREIWRQAGVPFRMSSVGKLMLRIGGIFSPLLRELVEMHYLQSDPVNLDDAKLERLIGPVPRTTYGDGIAQTLRSVTPALRSVTNVAPQPPASGGASE